MTITRLTLHPILYFGLCYRLIHATFLRFLRFQDYGVSCGSCAGAGFEGRHRLQIDDRSPSFIIVADRNAIIERYQEGVRITIKRRMRSTRCVLYG